MRLSLLVCLLAAVTWTATCGLASAQPADETAAEDWVKAQFSRSLSRPGKDITFDDAFKSIARVYFQADADGGGVTAADEVLHRDLASARGRSHLLIKFLALDLDGDGVVTRSEARRALTARAFRPLRGGGTSVQPTREQGQKILDDLMKKEFVGDLNSDSRITYDEMRTYADQRLRDDPRRWRGRQAPSIPSAFDRNADGRIVLDEIRVVAKRVFDAADTDGNGVLSPAEAAVAAMDFKAAQAAVRQAAKERKRREALIASVRSCGIPDLSDSKGLYYLDMGDGAALTNVSLGKKPTEVRLIHISIEGGPDKIDLIASGLNPVVYRFSGATDRVRRLIVVNRTVFENGTAKAAVLGLQRDRIIFGTGTDCLAEHSVRFGRRSGVDSYLKSLYTALGRKIDGYVDTGDLGEMKVPSLEIVRTRPPNNGTLRGKTPETKGLWQWAEHFNRAGLVSVPLDDLIAPGPVATHAVLPSASGLAQLIEAGVLQVTKWRKVRLLRSKSGSKGSIVIGNAKIVSDGMVIEARVPKEVRIVAKTELPVRGRGTVPQLRFLLAPGVPMPKNAGEHSCIFSEATGKKLSGHNHC